MLLLADAHFKPPVDREMAMAATITNSWKQLLIVRLNSGRTLYLAPRERSPAIEESEFSDNADVTKLVQRGWLAIEAT
jgi:hypothetical protein